MLRADGKELLFASNRVLKRALRDGPRGVFGPAEDVLGVPTSGVNAPQLSRDGRTLFLYRAPEGRPFRIYRAERSDVASATFGDPVEVEELEPSGQHSVFHPVIRKRPARCSSAAASRGARRTTPCGAPRCAATAAARPAGAVRRRPQPRRPALLHPARRAAGRERRRGRVRLDRRSPGQRPQPGRAGPGVEPVRRRAPVARRLRRSPAAVPECNTRGLDGSPAQCAWAWESGEHTTFAAWGRAADGTYVEPQEQGEEDCAVMFNSYTGGLWADITCTYPLAFAASARRRSSRRGERQRPPSSPGGARLLGGSLRQAA